MSFKNRIRLPIELTKPQYPQEKTVFRKANGESKTISVIIKKTYDGDTDWMPEKWHEKLTIALAHDDVTIEGDKYLGGVVMEGDYDIAWPDFLDYPMAPAKFKVQVTPFDASNSNCQSCEEATQIDLVDDTFEESLHEDTTYSMNVATNDNICCSPATFSIPGVYNANILSAASIDQSGNLTVTVKTDVVTANNALLLTYRVTCSNGGYDEANIYGNIIGSSDACEAPISIQVVDVSPTTATITWIPPDVLPLDGYIWDLFLAQAPGFSEQSGTTMANSLMLESLIPGSTYTLYVRSNCGDSVSNDITLVILTHSVDNRCGEYEVTYQIQPTDNPAIIKITYINCYGNTVNSFIVAPNIYRTICALQDVPGTPLHLITTNSSLTDIDYLGLC